MLKLKTIPVQWKTPLKMNRCTSAAEEPTITEDNVTQVEDNTSAVEGATQAKIVPVQRKSLP